MDDDLRIRTGRANSKCPRCWWEGPMPPCPYCGLGSPGDPWDGAPPQDPAKVPHHMKVEERPAPGCDNPKHRRWWMVCSCGFEGCCYGDKHGEVAAAVAGHRLSVIEAALGLDVKVGE